MSEMEKPTPSFATAPQVAWDPALTWAKGYMAVRSLAGDGSFPFLALAPITLGRLRVIHVPDEWTAGEHY